MSLTMSCRATATVNCDTDAGYQLDLTIDAQSAASDCLALSVVCSAAPRT